MKILTFFSQMTIFGIIGILTVIFPKEVGGVTQRVLFHPANELFRRYQVFQHKINLFEVTRHFLSFMCNLFHLK